MTSAQYSTYFTQQRNLGRRPIDIEVYPTANGFRYAAIWYQNTGNVGWIQLRGLSRTAYQNEIDEQAAAGYRVIDFEFVPIGLEPVLRGDLGEKSCRPLISGAHRSH